MSVLSEIETVITDVEQVIEKVVGFLGSIESKSELVLKPSQQLAVDLLNVLGKNSSNSLHLANINAGIARVTADADLADQVLKGIGEILVSFSPKVPDDAQKGAPEEKEAAETISPTNPASSGGDGQ